MNSDVPEHLERDGAVEPCPRPLEHPTMLGVMALKPSVTVAGEVGPEHGEDGRVQVLVGDRELVLRSSRRRSR